MFPGLTRHMLRRRLAKWGISAPEYKAQQRDVAPKLGQRS